MERWMVSTGGPRTRNESSRAPPTLLGSGGAVRWASERLSCSELYWNTMTVGGGPGFCEGNTTSAPFSSFGLRGNSEGMCHLVHGQHRDLPYLIRSATLPKSP